jgi:hypothetical protein
MSNNSAQFINLSYSPKEVRNTLRELVYGWGESEKNYSRLNSIVTNECGKRCMSDFKSNKLNTQEKICMTNCYTKFYDVLEIGENVFDKLNNRQVDLTPLGSGNFDDVLSKI